MRTRTLGLLSATFMIVAISGTTVVAGPQAGDISSGATDAAIVAEPDWTGQVTPLPEGAVFKTESGEDGGGAAGLDPDPVVAYSNLLGRYLLGPADIVAGTRFADDISLNCGPGAVLVDYKIRVSGDKEGDGSGVGPYSVDVALYDGCPGALRPGGQLASPIPGTEMHYDFPDNGLYERTITPSPLLEVELPANLYIGMTFSRKRCGTLNGAPATIGFSADLFDVAGVPCVASLGGYPGNILYFVPHASFWTEIRVKADTCRQGFVAYKNSNQNGAGFSKGNGVWFAEDVQLTIPNCDMIAYEVTVKGDGRIDFTWRTSLINGDLAAGRILPPVPPRQRHFGISGNDPQIVRFEFEEPVRLPESGLWFSAKPDSADVGVVLAKRRASLGNTEDLFAYYDSTTEVWIIDQIDPNGVRFAGFDLTIFCEGELPDGACCDLINRDDEGEAVCRELPEMNCGFPRDGFWQRDKRCGAFCFGGINDSLACIDQSDCAFCIGGGNDGNSCDINEPDETECPLGVCEGRCNGSFCTAGPNIDKACSRQADCPGATCVRGERDGLDCDPEDPNACPNGFCRVAECPGPFSRSCGIAACCQSDSGCDNLTENQCENLGNPEDPRLFSRGDACFSLGFHCPPGACLGREGECTIPHPEPGCANPFCCADVCAVDFFCCSVSWDPACAAKAFSLCTVAPANDECFSPADTAGARLVSIPSFSQSDAKNATAGADPGFCCHEGYGCSGGFCDIPEFETEGTCVGGVRDGKKCTTVAANFSGLGNSGPGSVGFATVWYKFVATETSVQLKTCGSNSPAKDSLIQAFSVADPDRGLCGDLSPCNVSADDCTDGSTCELDEEYACNNLNLLGCDDDTACSGQNTNSLMCLTNLTVGDTYYAMVAAKTEVPIDVTSIAFKFQVSAPCSTTRDPLSNDFCQNGIDLVGADVVEAFDLSGDTLVPATLPATFHCPGADCLGNVLQNDSWYTWTAPFADGETTITTCNPSFPSGDQPNTSLVVYRGCDCPVGEADIVGCSFITLGDCGLSAKVVFNAEENQCYTIRLGGHLGGTPAGELFIHQEAPPECPIAADVTFVDPLSGVIDARQPFDLADLTTAQGIIKFTVASTPGLDNPACNNWSLCESPDSGVFNGVSSITDNGGGTFSVELGLELTPGTTNTLTYTDDFGAQSVGVFSVLPGDVSADGTASAGDILNIIDILNGAAVAAWGPYSCDVDQSGVCGASDILRTIDLLNGAGAYNTWLGATVPGTCP